MSLAGIAFRILKESDIAELEAYFPEPAPGTHRRRIAKQRQGFYSYLCATADGKLAAILLIRWQGSNVPSHRIVSPHPEAGSLYVLPRYRRQGLASKLHAYCESMVAEKGYKGIGLAIKDSNTASVRLHISRGYTPVGKANPAKSAPSEPRTYYVKLLARPKTNRVFSSR